MGDFSNIFQTPIEQADDYKYVEDLNNTVNKSDLVTYIPELTKQNKNTLFLSPHGT